MANKRPLPLRRRRQTGLLAATASTEGGAIRSVQLGDVRWIDVLRPGPEEVELLGREFGFHPLAIEDSLSRIQRPKIDEYEGYLFIVMHFPVYYHAARTSVPSEVDFFVGPDYVITLHDGTLKPLQRLFDRVQDPSAEITARMGQSSGHVLYSILDDLVDYCFPIVNKVGQNIDAVERMIFEESSFRTVQEISILRRDIIALRRIVRPQIGVLSLLEHKQLPVLTEGISDYFGDLLDHVTKLWEILDDYRDVVDGLNDTNDSLTSHRINEVIKVLTIISVIMLPLTLITGVFGMNVPVPGEDSSYAAPVIVAALVLMAAGMLVYFKSRGWV